MKTGYKVWLLSFARSFLHGTAARGQAWPRKMTTSCCALQPLGMDRCAGEFNPPP